VGEKTVETGGRIRDMTEKLIGETFSIREAKELELA